MRDRNLYMHCPTCKTSGTVLGMGYVKRVCETCRGEKYILRAEAKQVFDAGKADEIAKCEKEAKADELQSLEKEVSEMNARIKKLNKAKETGKTIKA